MGKEFVDVNAKDPIAVFRSWMTEAEATEVNDPNAVALATSSSEGAPAVRMVLLKQLDARGFVFFTNAESQKGDELKSNPKAAMCFHWKSQRRQVRVEGTVEEVPGAEADTYFHSRSRRSQLGAAVSQQSRPLESRAELEGMVREMDAKFPGEIPRPEYWRGFVLRPERIEFWQDGDDRLHDRIRFEREKGDWLTVRLFP